MVVSIGVCDDEKAVCEQIRLLLMQYAHQKDCRFQISVFHSGKELLASTPGNIQILFLDIAMSGLTGMEVARKLHETSPSTLIIFVTSMVQYAVEGYSVHAFGFLPKPVSAAMLQRQLDDALRTLAARSGKTILVRFEGKQQLVNSNNICYVESFAHQMRLVLTDATLQCTVTMLQMEKDLAGCHFFRCHKCYLVNMRHIIRVDETSCVMTSGQSIPISRHRRQAFMQELNRFVGGWL